MILILLDIDGTLVNSMNFENQYYPQALCECLGLTRVRTDWESFSNPTDSGIVREVMREDLGKSCHPEDIDRCRERFIELLSGHLDEDPSAIAPIPGALQFIEHLQDHQSYEFAVATGAWKFSAEIKLTAAGFDFDDWVLYSCCEYEYKKEAMKAAHKEARQNHGSDFESVVYIGDLRSDMRLANELGYEFLGLGKQFSSPNVWGVDGINDFSDLRVVDGKIHRTIERQSSVDSG